MRRYGFTIFLSAFLLFQIQPMIAKFILPWFGGTANVWTTCMMFFQVALLLGYLYAHLLRKFFQPKTAWKIHVAMLICAVGSVVWNWAIPPDFLKPTGGENLTVAIVKLLAITVGLPFVVLSSTGPLVQAWHSLSHGGKTYRLYAVSNIGSMLALLSYPFVFERIFASRLQAGMWSIGFCAFAALCATGGAQTKKFKDWMEGSGPREPIKPPSITTAKISVWLLLAMAPSIMLMATTNLISQEVASIPFLWILPLTLYLLSLIICFDRPILYQRLLFTPLLLISTVIAILVLHISNQASLLPQVLSLALVCFAVSMSCHGEMERLKPDASQLTLFYLVVSLGGALGGIFVAAFAPRIFNDFCEFHTGLLLALILVVGIQIYEAYLTPAGKTLPSWLTTFGALISGGCVVSSLIYFMDFGSNPNLLTFQRNEYGLVSVRENGEYRVMVNGRTEHGGQYRDPKREYEPSGYYVQGSGPSVAIHSMRQFKQGGLKIGVLGLGTGSLVSWGEPDDEFLFYEINPLSEELARKYFTYLDDPDRTKVFLGDGRVQLEKQLRESGSNKFDILFLDAFSSDSIPAHLLTKESFDLYWSHLNPDGILVAHITNRFVNLKPVIVGQAERTGHEPILIRHENKTGGGTTWVLITQNRTVIESEFVKNSRSPFPADLQPIMWTDDFASLAQVVDWSFRLKWNSKPESQNTTPTAKSKATSTSSSK